jgi:enterochelin esterase-like enzyme
MAGVLALVFSVPSTGQTPAKQGTIERLKVRGPALVGNLQGESPDRDVFIYLPPGYATSRNQRYPVVYLLHGYSLTAERWMDFTRLGEVADRAIAAGTMKGMILVSPDGYTRHGGSMWSSSPTIGDWETYIAEDLVGYVDKNYRTLATRESRGLAGHSMGGYGTLRIGMKRPDVFSAMYPMSSCCVIDANLTGNRGRGAGPAGQPGARGGQPPAANAPAAGAAPAAPAAPPAAAANAPQGAGRAGAGQGAGQGAAAGRGAGAGRGGRGGGFGDVQSGLAAAWAPNPKNPPNFFDTPVKDGEVQPLVVARFAANSPYAMLPQYVTNLKKYKAIKLDCGLQDGLIGQNRQLVESMEALGVPHVFETYEGDHTNRVVERIEQKVLPFFSENLAFTAPKK